MNGPMCVCDSCYIVFIYLLCVLPLPLNSRDSRIPYNRVTWHSQYHNIIIFAQIEDKTLIADTSQERPEGH